MKVRISGTRWDGEYDLDTDQAWTTREWGWIKKLSGYMPLTVGEGLAGDDPELFVAVGVIALVRDHKIGRDEALPVAEEIMDLRGVSIVLMADPVEEDEVPLDLTGTPGGPSPNVSPLSSELSRESESSSGPTSMTGSEPLDENPLPTTLLRLGISST
jgi:hypothetical protein